MNPEEPAYEPSRVGTRRYARGRGYDPDRYSYNGITGAVEETSSIDEGISQELEEKLRRAAEPAPAQDDDAGNEE